MKEANILIVDDNKSILSTLKLLLKGKCSTLKTLSNPNLLLNELSSFDYNILLLDMNFSAGINTGNEGLYWLKQVKDLQPDLSVVMITAYGDVELAVKAVRQGASDFILKPWDNDKLLVTLESAYRLNQSKTEVGKLKLKEKQLIAEINKTDRHIIGSSEKMQRVLKLIHKVAKTDANVLITGENGTGKELVARELHRLSNRSNQVMVTVDMGAVTESLFESELFGHVKGAFTDAKNDRIGKFETAHGGTLFLDELGNLPLSMQSKLLSAIQSRTITKVGDNKPVKVDVRLVCATNCNLHEMVSDGGFREDLLYRVNTIQIEVPPLRDRIDDIDDLVGFFLDKYARHYGKKGLVITEDAIAKLKKYHWPGNIRELQHAIEKAVILCENHEISSNDFAFKAQNVGMDSLRNATIEEMEIALIKKAIARFDHNMSAAADNLGITRQTLYNKIKKYGIKTL